MAQVLARPGWAGSGVAPEAWWRRAIFYRIDPGRFQDADGDGKGDLQGITERLDYLQSLGVDALLLDGQFDPDGLEDLVRAASQHHLRVVVAVGPALARSPRNTLLSTVHDWLSAGVAGISFPSPNPGTQPDIAYPALVDAFRQMLRSLPGERVLLTDPVPMTPTAPSPAPLRHVRRSQALGALPAQQPARGGQLITAAAFPVDSAGVAQLRSALAGATLGVSPETNTLLQFAADPRTGSPNAAAFAAMLLASRGAAIVGFGDEIGLDLYPGQPASTTSTQSVLPVMQWTPSNHTPALAEQPAGGAKPAASAETEYGAYHPYQPPPRGLAGIMPASPHVTVDANIPPPPPDANTLPGFTAGTLSASPVDGARLNVVTEDRDPRSLLNAYRAMVGLHHDNATLRNGSQFLLNRDAAGALVWIRRAPAGSRTVANVVAAANLTDQLVTLTLDGDIEALGMRPGALRPLLAYARLPMTGETTANLALPPHAVFLGEIYHSGALPQPAREHASRSARRRHSR